MHHLATSRGWQIVERHIQSRIEQARTKLVREAFSDLSDVKALQAQAQAYEEILGFVRGLAKEAVNSQEE